MLVHWPKEFGSFHGNLDRTHSCQLDITFFWLWLEFHLCSSGPFIISVRIGFLNPPMWSPLFVFFCFFLKHSFTLGAFSGFLQVRLCHYCTSVPIQVFIVSTILFLSIAYVFTNGALAGFHCAPRSMLFLFYFWSSFVGGGWCCLPELWMLTGIEI